MPRRSIGRTAADTHALYVRCSSREKAEIRKAARRAGYVSTAEYLRVLIRSELERQKILLAKRVRGAS